MPDPDYYSIIRRETVEALAEGDDALAQWAREMIGSVDEEAVFLRGARVYFANSDRAKRRKAIWYLASTFGAEREELKRYLRFKGLVNQLD